MFDVVILVLIIFLVIAGIYEIFHSRTGYRWIAFVFLVIGYVVGKVFFV